MEVYITGSAHQLSTSFSMICENPSRVSSRGLMIMVKHECIWNGVLTCVCPTWTWGISRRLSHSRPSLQKVWIWDVLKRKQLGTSQYEEQIFLSGRFLRRQHATEQKQLSFHYYFHLLVGSTVLFYYCTKLPTMSHLLLSPLWPELMLTSASSMMQVMLISECWGPQLTKYTPH